MIHRKAAEEDWQPNNRLEKRSDVRNVGCKYAIQMEEVGGDG